ncbi:terminase small subunit [Hydrogenoanaerobacterium sp.]|uniref:terminase small subunit n=1 Tax=Hydrogenoanaerobacterium sp. TaxID=2953763 RepID=UPI00289BA39C|nr:terminase small subunit [Hydrogenoanaerobacterium sp.]
MKGKQNRKKRTKFDEKQDYAAQVKAGLHRLAFGSIADAVKLLFFEDAPTTDELTELDLFHIAELKRGKNGVEVKFFDRFKAMELLAGLAEDKSKEEDALPFYQAILGSLPDSTAKETDVSVHDEV